MELIGVKYDFHDFLHFKRNVERLNYLLFNLKKLKGRSNEKEREQGRERVSSS